MTRTTINEGKAVMFVCVCMILLLAALGLLIHGRGARDPPPRTLLALLLLVLIIMFNHGAHMH